MRIVIVGTDADTPLVLKALRLQTESGTSTAPLLTKRRNDQVVGLDVAARVADISCDSLLQTLSIRCWCVYLLACFFSMPRFTIFSPKESVCHGA